MDYNLDVSIEAHEDTDGIAEYITQKLFNPSAAASFLDDVHTSYLRLKENPYIYSLCQDSRLQAMGYRKAVIKNYIILFRIEGKTVHVVRIVYGGRNYADLV
ncbi:MAG: type II toxin-antitoxin system RelE/ParE family toxin [Oscillospiraceae bacterium]|nr:type II toxin-antitoxin system RelE/ParE family toxin [Oscillospiraceae bacterium]